MLSSGDGVTEHASANQSGAQGRGGGKSNNSGGRGRGRGRGRGNRNGRGNCPRGACFICAVPNHRFTECPHRTGGNIERNSNSNSNQGQGQAATGAATQPEAESSIVTRSSRVNFSSSANITSLISKRTQAHLSDLQNIRNSAIIKVITDNAANMSILGANWILVEEDVDRTIDIVSFSDDLKKELR
ncbi:MAG: hypothetical protein ACREOZ_04520 [Gloeomargaritales cyanobacterium]